MRRRAGRPGGGRKKQIPSSPEPGEMNHLITLCRERRFGEALGPARRMTRQYPGHAVGWFALAACMEAAGQMKDAVTAYRRAVKIEPENADGHNNLGLLLARMGDFAESEKSYRQAIKARPGFVEAWFNLALLMSDTARRTEANECFQEVLRHRPRFPEAYNGLANNLEAMGDLDGAEAGYREALKFQPGHADILSNLANVLARKGDVREAEDTYRSALRASPSHTRVMTNLALLLTESGRADESAELYADVVRLEPESASARLGLGNALAVVGKLDDAEACFRAALSLDPVSAAAHAALGNVLMDLGKLQEAEASHQRACDLDFGNPSAHRLFGNVMAILGKPEQAQQAFRRALELDPEDAESWYHYAQVKRFSEEDPDLGRLDALVNGESQDHERQMFLNYALGKARAEAGHDPNLVFACWSRAGQHWRALNAEDPEAELEELNSIIRVFTPQTMGLLPEAIEQTDAPIFIVGMPRSGTTLVEQILASHPQVHGAGERKDLQDIVDTLGVDLPAGFPDWVEQSPDLIGTLGQRYRQRVTDPFPQTSRVTDKMPDNFRYLGLIAAALPNARIIHVQRSPMDTCLSCFERFFVGKYAFSYDLQSLGRYYLGYQRLMAHWRQLLPSGMMLELNYEALIDDPDTLVAALLSHCGLPWDDRCLTFYETRRAVPTASLVQVREPMYRRSIGRWKRYQTQLQPLLTLLNGSAIDRA